MITAEERRVANAVGGKTARACDGCIKKRAKWYCAADDAFLCQSCDTSVHSANPLARRHERVRLKTTSLKSVHKTNESATPHLPTWHQGVKRKARTPRGKPHKHGDDSPSKSLLKCILRVPEMEENEDETEQLLYRVPVFDPFVQLLTDTSNSETNNSEDNNSTCTALASDSKEEELKEFLATELDLTEFEADVESLLNGSLEKESSLMEDLGLKDETEMEFYPSSTVKVKIETDQEMIGIGEKEIAAIDGQLVKFSLRLDYDSIIASWAAHGSSPWTTGTRPEFVMDDGWPDYSVRGSSLSNQYNSVMGHEQGTYVLSEVPRAASVFMGGFPAAVLGDGGREARVSRYREKRRTRLFSKKIRYEVRKLNAEKRPRMKGRFVKRASSSSLLLH